MPHRPCPHPCPGRQRRARGGAGGFTLIEVLVALTLMAVMAALTWQGIDGMARAQQSTRQYTDQVLTLQAALGQWRLDLDAQIAPPALGPIEPTRTLAPEPQPIDWDGQVLRLTRMAAQGEAAGIQVVAWTRGADGQWSRWASAPLRTLGEWRQAWQQAQQWAPGADAGLHVGATPGATAQAVALLPISDWQVFYYRNNAWSNALSSAGADAPSGAASGGNPSAPATAGTPPDGVRLRLTPAPGQAIAGGALTLDWVRPTRGGGR